MWCRHDGCLEWKGKYHKTDKSAWKHSLYGRSCDVSLKVETQRALSLHYCRALTDGDSPTRDTLLERFCVVAQSPTMSVNHEHSPQLTVSNRTDPHGIPISRRLSFRRVPSRATTTLRATGCNLVPAGVCGVLGDATPARNLLSQGPSHDDDDSGVRNRETGTTGRQAGRQADGRGWLVGRRRVRAHEWHRQQGVRDGVEKERGEKEPERERWVVGRWLGIYP